MKKLTVIFFLIITGALTAQSNTSMTVPSTGLLAHYKFNGNILDASGSGNDGTIYGGATTDSVLNIGSTSDYAEIPASLLDGRTEYTIAGWIRTDVPTQPSNVFISAANSSMDNEILLYRAYNSGSDNWVLWIKGQSSVLAATPEFSEGNWHHIVLTRSNDWFRFYYDGNLMHEDTSFGTGVPAAVIAAGGLIFGQDQDNVGGGFQDNQTLKGELEEVLFYDRALSDNEVAIIFNEQPVLTITKPDPGDRFELFNSYDIRWDVPDIGNINIDYTTGDGSVWTNIQTNWPSTTDFDGWMFDDTVYSKSAVIRVMENYNPGVAGRVFGVFMCRGLVGEYLFNGTSSDSSGWLSDLSWDAAPMSGTDRHGIAANAVYLDGNNRGEGDNFTTIFGADPEEFSAAVWFRLESGSAVFTKSTLITDYYSGSGGDFDYAADFGIDYSTTDTVLHFEMNETTLGITSLTGSTKIETGRWYHAAYTVNNRTGILRIYLNGKLEAETSFTTGNYFNSSILSLGARLDNSNSKNTFQGQLDEVRFYDYVLSPADISEMYDLNQTLTLTNPLPGKTVEEFSIIQIEWTGSAGLPAVILDASDDDGLNWQNVIHPEAAFRDSLIEVPAPPAGQFKLRIMAANDSLNADIIDDYLYVSQQPEKQQRFLGGDSGGFYYSSSAWLDLTAPTGGSTLIVGSQETITWDGEGVDTLFIEFSRGVDSGWQTIASKVSAGNERYDWTVPNKPTNNGKIVIADVLDTRTGDEMTGSFTIPIPSLEVNYPNGGETLTAGDGATITWKETNLGGLVNIQLSTDNGSNWVNVDSNIDVTSGSYQWTVPNYNSTECILRISSKVDNTIMDVSNSQFTINPATSAGLRLAYPTAASDLAAGYVFPIKWTNTNTAVTNIDIFYSSDGGSSYSNIYSNIPVTTGIVAWQVPASDAGNTGRIFVAAANDPSVADTSGDFTISTPYLDLDFPVGGEVLGAGTTQSITWTTNLPFIELEYSSDGGSSFIPISGVDSVRGDLGYYDWSVPTENTIEGRIKIVDYQKKILADSSASDFIIFGGGISLAAPQGGEVLEANGQFTIEWLVDPISIMNVEIEFSSDGGSNFEDIATVTVDSFAMSYNWKIPDISSGQCVILVKDAADYSTSDQSNKFEIYQPYVQLSRPSGGETLNILATDSIEWSNSPDVEFVDIFLSYNDYEYRTVVSNYTASGGMYIWSDIDSHPAGENCRIIIRDAADHSVRDSTDYFTLIEPYIEILYPLAGDDIRSDAPQKIVFFSEFVEYVNIYYALDTGDYVEDLVLNLSVTGDTTEYIWHTPALPNDSIGYLEVEDVLHPKRVWDGTSGFFDVFIFPPDILLQRQESLPGGVKSLENYRIVGLPGFERIPMSDVMPGELGEDWYAFWDTGEPTDYFVPYDGSSTFEFGEGHAFWVMSPGFDVDKKVANPPLDTNNRAVIQIHNEWNLITNPFLTVVNWERVKEANGLPTGDNIMDYTGAGYGSTNTFEPFRGYYFFNRNNLMNLLIPYNSSGTINKDKLKKQDEPDSVVTLSLLKDGKVYGKVSAGFNKASDYLLDDNDVFMPPSDLVVRNISLINNEIRTNYKRLAREYRPSVDTGQVFNMEIKGKIKEEVKIEADGLDKFGDLEVYLVDMRLYKFYDLKEESGVKLNLIHEKNPYDLLVGTSEFIENKKKELLPGEFTLYQNYPNPFNPSTYIRFALPKTSDVKIEIYNILGERVELLANHTYAEGYYEMLWDASQYASGVYICVIQAISTTGRKFSKANKMMLIK